MGGDLEPGGVDHPEPLELSPEGVKAGLGEDEIELDVGLVGLPGGVGVNEVKEVGAGAEEVAPGAEPGREPVEGGELEKEHGFKAGDRLFGFGAQFDLEIWRCRRWERLGGALHVERGGQELRGTTGRVEVGKEAIETGERELGMKEE